MKIEYISTQEFESEHRSVIHAEAEALIQDHLWWNEPLTLFDRIDYPHHLTGESNLIRDYLHDAFGPRREIERKDDVYLALIDYLKIIDVLEQLSEKHAIGWRLYFSKTTGNEVTIGFIEAGKAAPGVLQFMVDTLERYALSHDSLWDDAEKHRVYSKYFDETDSPIYNPL
ncbi:hypothetical protein [Coraliomargarita akajimensis]|uniref:Uncharacterized protein n=1 Tax=Coraliomargarita akajimensis (strain DSM 45221 / IAM 15411 / JCM 23193 / KCTC 12865 / 04OKA010-24) TaxID=583355 RepID=D5ER57_CORAD|nr:hypothetical protein [Coraliomargarita akajimensis]ADE55901.1 hypothetical protein Caka_2888 [Coraliomargarita akajimensis DSM 45221]